MTSILTDWGKRCIEKLVKGVIAEARFVFCLSCIANEFDEEKARLKPERETLGDRVKVAKRRNKDIPPNVVSWEKEVDELIQEDTKEKQTCFFGFCPDCLWRYKRGKKLANDTMEVKRLMEKVKEFVNIEVPRPPPGVERNSLQDYISFESRKSEYKSLLDALKDDSNFITGLQGMGGTGKTTLAIKVGRELKESGEFTDVIVTTVSSTPDIKKIQNDIAGPLDLKFDGCTESDRPGKLWDRLTNGDKILLILDDVWEGDPLLNFDAIGIPKQDNHKGCRVLLTTRSKQILNKMNFDKTIELGLLSEDDAWIMFEKYADLSNCSSKSVIGKGHEIAKACKQLPVAIAVTARSLKGQQDRVHEWDVTLKSLKKHVPMHGVDDDMVGIYTCLKFSYDYMKDEKAKRLFLLCSIFREDQEIHVELLTRLCIGAGLFGEDYGSYNDARNKVVALKNKLLDSCLLLKVDENRVKMHDLIRDVAQWIANKEIWRVNLSDKIQKSLIERETNINCLLCEGKYKDLFFGKFDASRLETLIAIDDRDEDYKCMEIPNSFFENILNLRVLILYCSGNRSLSLGNSFQSLTNIRSLMVHMVDLGDISTLGNLQSLESLDLCGCKINELPSKITNLKKFKVLNLEDCEIRMHNPFEVIEICSSLEELYFKDSFNDFCREITLPELQRYHIGIGWGECNGSLLKQVVLDEKVYGYFTKGTLEYFMRTADVLQLTNINSGWRNHMPEVVPIKYGMNDLVELHLEDDPKLMCLIDTDSQVPKAVFSKLAVLKLEQMERLEELCNGSISLDSLNNLEKLTIKQCEKLRSLFRGSPNICSLKKLKIDSCSTLISVFDLTTSQSLLKLETLIIEDCEQLKSIFTYERRGDDKMEDIVDGDNDNNKSCNSMFPNLKVLNIVDCPQLQFILPCHSAGDLLSLESISIGHCDKLTQLIKHPWDDTIEEIVNGDNDKNSSCNSIMFPKLKKVYVNSCPQLEFVLPILSAQDVQLASLEKLDLRDLPNFIDISRESNHSKHSSIKRSSNSISKTQTQLEPTKSNVFSWSHICCHRYKLKGPTSTENSLVSEGQLKDFSISSDHLWERAQCLSRLSHIMCNIKELMLVNLSKIKSVFVLSITSRMMLESLTIESCDELKHIIVDIGDSSGSDSTVFPKLKELKVKNCGKLEYIFGHIDDSDDHQNHNLHLPALKCLKLSSLPSLTGVCTKNYRTTFPPLAVLELGDCTQVDIKSIGDFIVKELSGNVKHFAALERLKVDNSKVESICCLKEVSELEMNLGLQNIELYTLPMLTCLFKGLKKSFSLKNLTKMKIKGCEKLEIVFSTSIIMSLPQLLHIKIEECKELKHLIECDLENRKTVCFPKLKTVVVEKCKMLKNVFPICICKELPELEVLIIRESDKLEEIFVCEEDEKVNIPNLKFVAFVNLPTLCQTQGVHFQAVRCHSVQHCKNFSLTSAPREDIRKYIYWFHDHPEREMYMDFYTIIKKSQEETRAASRHMYLTIFKVASGHMLTSSQEMMNQQHSLGEIDTTIKLSLGNDNLEGSTSEKPVAEPLSTISATENEPPIQVIDHKRKGIMITNEEGTALTNTKTISKHITTSQDQSTQEGSTSGTKNDQDIQLDSHETAQTNNDQESKGCGNGNENPSVETTKDFDVGSKVQAASSGHEMTSSQLQGSTSDKTAAETKNEPTAHLVSPKLKGIKTNAEKGFTSTNATTITSSNQLELADGDGKIAMTTSFSNDEVSDAPKGKRARTSSESDAAPTKGKRARTSTESEAAVAKSEVIPVSVKDKGKMQKVGAASIPQKRRKGKADLVITKEQLEEALEDIEKEEAEPKLKKKKAPLQLVSPMVEMTPIRKMMADERASDLISDKKDLKAQYIHQRDEKLKALGMEDCDRYFKDKLAEVRAIAGKTTEDNEEEEMMIIMEDAPEDGTSEVVPQAAGPQKITSEVGPAVQVIQIPVTSIPISPSSPSVPEPIEDTSVLDNLILHYSGDLPKDKFTSEKASETTPEAAASENVASENPHQHTPEPHKPTTPPQSPIATIDPQLNTQTSTSPQQPPTEIEHSPEPTPMDVDNSQVNVQASTSTTHIASDQPSSSNTQTHFTIPVPNPVQDLEISDSDLETLEQPPTNILESGYINVELLTILSQMHNLVDQRRTIDLTSAYEDSWASLQNRATGLIEDIKAKCIRVKQASVRRLMKNLNQSLRVRSSTLLLANQPFFSEKDYLTREARLCKLLKKQMAQQQQEAREREQALLQRQQQLEELLQKKIEEMEKMKKQQQTNP